MSTLKKTLSRYRRHARVRAKVSGSSSKPRLVVFRSNANIEAQLVDDEKGITLVGVSSISLPKAQKTDQAKEVGKRLAELASARNIQTVVFDRNGYRFHGRVKALADAAREAGLQF